jgi:hypothetical protein
MSLSAKRPSQSIKTQLLKEVRSHSEPKKRLNAEVEASLYRRLKAHSAIEGRSISDITRQLWLEYLSKHSKE